MTNAPYFTEDTLLIKKGRMIQEAQVLQGRKAALDSEWSKYAASWRALGHADAKHMTIRFAGDAVNVLNPSQSFSVVDSVPQAHFDVEAINRLCQDREDTDKALKVLEGQLRSFGISLMT